MKFDISITPYECVNSFFFGKTPAEIRKENGKARREIKDNFMNIYIEERNGIELRFDKKKLSAVFMFKDTDPKVHGISIFSDDALAALSKLDTPIIGKDRAYALFNGLGLCVGGISGRKIREKHLAVAFSKEIAPAFITYVNT